MIPPPLQDLTIRVAALNGPLGDRVADAFARLVRGAGALAWARDQLPGLLACATEFDVLSHVVTEAAALTGAPEVWAVRWTGPAGESASLSAIAGKGTSDGPMAVGAAVLAPAAVSRSIVARVLKEGKPAFSDDARAEAELRGAASIQVASLRSLGCLPLGRNGVLYLADPSTPARFDADARARLAALCEIAAPFLARSPVAQPVVSTLPDLIGTSPPMRELASAVRAFAPMPWPALVLGETGTGKEAVARALHDLSPRKGKPFLPINCGAIPDELAESLLFGHERGAFTGADRRKEGIAETVGEGTLFLDEVGELSPRLQVKLLRLLQQGTYTRVGGDRELRFAGRIVAATHRRIDSTGEYAFRADLYHRLAACVLRVPPLRDRREDIPALADHLLARALSEVPGARPLGLAPDALAWLQVAEWPGNVRELENTLRSAIARGLAGGVDRLKATDLGGPVAAPVPPLGPPAGGGGRRPEGGMSDAPDVAVPAAPADPTNASPGALPSSRPLATAPEAKAPFATATAAGNLSTAVDTAQRARVYATLAACNGNKSAAAVQLGVSRQWLHRLLARWEQA